jgi:hypothetical protein
MAEDLTKDDIVAILKANRELGPEYDEHTADQILERVKATQAKLATSARPSDYHRERRLLIPLFALSIPLIGVAGQVAHTPGVLAVLGLDAMVIWSTRHH